MHCIHLYVYIQTNRMHLFAQRSSTLTRRIDSAAEDGWVVEGAFCAHDPVGASRHLRSNTS